MDIVEQAQVLLLTPRGYPIAPLIKLPASVVQELPALLHEVQRIDPSCTFEVLVRSIWRAGTKRLRTNVLRGVRFSQWDKGGTGNAR